MDYENREIIFIPTTFHGLYKLLTSKDQFGKYLYPFSIYMYVFHNGNLLEDFKTKMEKLDTGTVSQSGFIRNYDNIVLMEQEYPIFEIFDDPKKIRIIDLYHDNMKIKELYNELTGLINTIKDKRNNGIKKINAKEIKFSQSNGEEIKIKRSGIIEKIKKDYLLILNQCIENLGYEQSFLKKMEEMFGEEKEIPLFHEHLLYEYPEKEVSNCEKYFNGDDDLKDESDNIYLNKKKTYTYEEMDVSLNKIFSDEFLLNAKSEDFFIKKLGNEYTEITYNFDKNEKVYNECKRYFDQIIKKNTIEVESIKNIYNYMKNIYTEKLSGISLPEIKIINQTLMLILIQINEYKKKGINPKPLLFDYDEISESLIKARKLNKEDIKKIKFKQHSFIFFDQLFFKLENYLKKSTRGTMASRNAIDMFKEDVFVRNIEMVNQFKHEEIAKTDLDPYKGDTIPKMIVEFVKTKVNEDKESLKTCLLNVTQNSLSMLEKYPLNKIESLGNFKSIEKYMRIPTINFQMFMLYYCYNKNGTLFENEDNKTIVEIPADHMMLFYPKICTKKSRLYEVPCLFLEDYTNILLLTKIDSDTIDNVKEMAEESKFKISIDDGNNLFNGVFIPLKMEKKEEE